MTETPKQVLIPPPTRFWRSLILTAIVLFVLGIIFLIAGKFIFGAILALFAAVLGVGSQVGKDNKL